MSGTVPVRYAGKFCLCATREEHPASECTVPGASEMEVVRDDVRAILEALGLGTHARPYSTHAVVHREILPALREVRQGGGRW